ncbi:MAG: DNA cytosine methyltransferase, partial [Flavobacteriales bacterium]
MRNLFMHSETGGNNYIREKAIEAAKGKILIIKLDCFCGIGGVTDSAKRVELEGNPAIKVIVAINHSEDAIEIHEANNPDVEHFIEDIRLVSMMKLKSIIEFWKNIYPDALLSIWFSAECTNLSNAKGGMSRNPDSRTLSNDIFRYIEALNPDYIFIENVQEIMAWGPVRIRVKAKHKGDIKNGVFANSELKTFINKDTGLEEYHYEPWSKKNGLYFQAWRDGIIACGYNYGYKILDSADYGAYQSRERYFAVFAKPGLPLSFPKPT